MAQDQNQCNFTGRLGKDPDTRFTASGTAVSNFSIACGRKYKDKEETQWIDCVVFGKLGEICQQYLKKGSFIRITGRLQNRDWQDKDGNKRRSTEILVEDMGMLDSKGDNSGNSSPEYSGRQDAAPQKSAGAEASGPSNPDDFDDDIPF